MKKLILLAFLIGNSLSIFSQKNSNVPEKKEQSGFFAVDFLSVEMPFNATFLNEPNMGLTGIHYNLKFDNFYTGLGIYGSVTGKRGGLFTLGINAGFQKYLSERFFIDTGLHFGGGGGAGAPDGGGAFILPHLNLGYDFKDFSLTTGYSYINFFDGGDITSHQINIALQIPMDFSYSSYKNAESSFSSDEIKASDWNQNGTKTSFMLHLNNLSVKGGSQDTNGLPLAGETIRLAGFEFNSYLSDSWFFLIKADGAYDGIPAGYMDILLGAGYHLSLNNDRTNILAKLAIGAGGGGGVDTQGGVLVYPDISLEQHISDNVYLSVNKGFLMSPNSFFKSSTLGFGLKYYTNINGLANTSSKNTFKEFEIILKQDMYLNADRDLAPTQHLHQISMQLNFSLTKSLYVAGQTSFANFGNAGAYAEGIVGIGLKTNSFFNEKVALFGQVLAGAAGGGHISTGEGLIIKPSIGGNWFLNDELSLRGALGYVKAYGGDLSSPFLNVGISYRFSFLSSN
ncbi:hypothetical protein RQM59_12715 [Flavobacteriaceae bacterium S356]|uniref:DUF5723 domain-containing protein n=1 Tax=Asprobacillus argus TaxID=3076534 RepID=A0ABU3LI22_9FLAO|nr:hypothetical protein [Flavobacteriaceae bacterium S356]